MLVLVRNRVVVHTATPSSSLLSSACLPLFSRSLAYLPNLGSKLPPSKRMAPSVSVRDHGNVPPPPPSSTTQPVYNNYNNSVPAPPQMFTRKQHIQRNKWQITSIFFGLVNVMLATRIFNDTKQFKRDMEKKDFEVRTTAGVLAVAEDMEKEVTTFLDAWLAKPAAEKTASSLRGGVLSIFTGVRETAQRALKEGVAASVLASTVNATPVASSASSTAFKDATPPAPAAATTTPKSARMI